MGLLRLLPEDLLLVCILKAIVILQALSTELMNSVGPTSYPTKALKRIINKLLRKCSTDGAYVNDLVKNFHFSSSLFRLLTTSINKDHVAPLAVIAKTILQCKTALGRPKNPLVIILRTFVNKNNYSEITASLPTSKAEQAVDGKFHSIVFIWEKFLGGQDALRKKINFTSEYRRNFLKMYIKLPKIFLNSFKFSLLFLRSFSNLSASF